MYHVAMKEKMNLSFVEIMRAINESNKPKELKEFDNLVRREDGEILVYKDGTFLFSELTREDVAAVLRAGYGLDLSDVMQVAVNDKGQPLMELTYRKAPEKSASSVRPVEKQPSSD